MTPTNDDPNGNADLTAAAVEELRVSFRQDVIFHNSETNNKSNRSGASLQSFSSDASPNKNSNGNRAAAAAAAASASPHKGESYVRLRSNLTREQINRDPFYFYQVTKHLGSGSMGDVLLVKKRPDKVGGSARRDIQQAVQRLEQARRCLNIPLVGSVLQLCINPTLQDELNHEDDSLSNGNSIDKKLDSTRNAFVSVNLKKGGKGGDDRTATTVSTGRSFEDSLLGKSASSLTNGSSTTSSPEIVYAMKSILLSQVTDQTYIDELRNEIAILKDLDHPNIVRAIETFEYRGKISIIMEVCSGGDLYAREPYSEADAARIVRSMLSAIAYMHGRQIVHRDLKFENVLFVNSSPLSEIKLIDFGLSKVYVNQSNRKLTDTVGTIYTMAPEVILGEHTEKADMWSIAVIAFMLLSSSMPFYGKDRMHVVKRILNNKYHFKARRWQRVSDPAKQFIQSLLVADPEERPTAEQALESAWLKRQLELENVAMSTKGGWTLRAEEEEMVRAAMLKYARYPKLKKMVRICLYRSCVDGLLVDDQHPRVFLSCSFASSLVCLFVSLLFLSGAHGRGAQVQQRRNWNLASTLS